MPSGAARAHCGQKAAFFSLLRPSATPCLLDTKTGLDRRHRAILRTGLLARKAALRLYQALGLAWALGLGLRGVMLLTLSE